MAKAELPHQSSDDPAGVILISYAGTDTGYRLACEFLQSGHRVVVTGRHTTALTRILHGCDADQVLALAADLSDPDQFDEVLARTEIRLGRVALVIDGRTGQADPQWPNRFHLFAASDVEDGQVLLEESRPCHRHCCSIALPA